MEATSNDVAAGDTMAVDQGKQEEDVQMDSGGENVCY